MSKERLEQMCLQDTVMREKQVMKLVQGCSPYIIDFDCAFMCQEKIYFQYG